MIDTQNLLQELHTLLQESEAHYTRSVECQRAADEAYRVSQALQDKAKAVRKLLFIYGISDDSCVPYVEGRTLEVTA